MNVLWTAHDNKKNGNFTQTKAEILCLTSCVMFIKHYYPTFKTNFFLDKTTLRYFENFGLTSLFDSIDSDYLSQDFKINSKIYWAFGKILIQKLFKGPTLMLDLDFRIFSDLDKLGVFDSDISCLWLEGIDNESYMKPQTAMSYTCLDWKLPWDRYSFNTSFLYFKDENIRNKYCDLAIEYMKSNYKILPDDMNEVENRRFMMFVEQYMLKQISNLHKARVKILVDDFYAFPKDNSIESCGLKMSNSGNYFYHYGDHKSQHMIKKDNFCLNEIQQCYEITNKVIKNSKHLEIFNNIFKIDINAECFSQIKI